MRVRPVSPNLGEYLTVGEAAQFLGVSIVTLRRWDRADKFKPIRHPINGYRLYGREQLLSLLPGPRPEEDPRDAGVFDHRAGSIPQG